MSTVFITLRQAVIDIIKFFYLKLLIFSEVIYKNNLKYFMFHKISNMDMLAYQDFVET